MQPNRPNRFRHRLLQIHEKILGRDTFELIRHLNETEDDLERERLEAVKQLFRHSSNHIPYWGDRLGDIDIDRFQWADLTKVPVLTRSEIVQHREQMRWRGPGKDLKHQSGGTTDDNLVFYWGRERQSWDRATRYRGLQRLGIHPGDRVLHIWPREYPETWSERVRVRLRDFRDELVADPVIDPRPWTESNLEVLGKQIDQFQPKAIVAYPSWLIQISRVQRRNRNLFRHRPQLILTCGEILFDQQRQEIEEAFGTTVYQEYGSQDAGLIAHEDADKILYFNREPLQVELLKNGLPVEPGGLGEVIITHFHTPRMPFIRYATGDVARAPAVSESPSKISCREQCPLPEGRTSDLLLSEDRSLVASRSLVDAILRESGIDLFSLHQKNPDQIQVLCKRDAPESFDSVAESILRNQLGQSIDLSFHRGEAFRTLRSGKHRYVCCPLASAMIGHDKQSGSELARSWPQLLEPTVP